MNSCRRSGLENISEYALSLSLYDDGKLEKLLLRYMYGFGDRIVRGG